MIRFEIFTRYPPRPATRARREARPSADLPTMPMKPAVVSICRFLHRHLLWCLVAAYLLGAFWPRTGLWIRGFPGSEGAGGWLLRVMLGLMLFNAGLGIDRRRLADLARRWATLAAAVILGAVVPLLFVVVTGMLMWVWAVPASNYRLVLGLAVIAAMPVAGSSTAWSQNADGNLALSLGLVLVSTLLSPLVALAVLHAISATMPAEVGSLFVSMASHVTAVFLALWVILPAVAGMLVRRVVGRERCERAKPYLKLINVADLLLLNYANASLSLPSLIESPTPLRVGVVVLATVTLAALTFGVAVPLASFCRAERSERTSLLFGLGMKNNGAGLVLVSTALVEPGDVLLPIIFYNLAQHLAAAAVDRFVIRADGDREQSEPGCQKTEDSAHCRFRDPASFTAAGAIRP